MFRKLSESVYASPQIDVAQVAEAAAQGIVLIINNRPEGESDDQTPGAAIEAAARAAGIGYVAIPITHAGFSQPQVSAIPKARAHDKRAANLAVFDFELSDDERGRIAAMGC